MADCLNFRAYCWMMAKRLLQMGCMLPVDEMGDKLVHELTLPEYDYDERGGRLKIEEKESLTKRNGGESTDLADAFTILALPTEQSIQRQYRNRYMRGVPTAAGRRRMANVMQGRIGRSWRGR